MKENEVEIQFEREDLQGIVAVGSYLVDAMKRFGIRQEAPCVQAKDEHHCAIDILSGADLLSPRTEAENRFFADVKDSKGKRLSCQTRFDRSGEVVVMTEEKKTEEAAENGRQAVTDEEYLKAFSEMPLERKIASLVKLEAAALSDTLAYVANAPYTVAEKVMDLMAEFGFRRHAEEKASVRPPEHAEEKKAENGTASNGSAHADGSSSEKSADEKSSG